jgi:hypothetical protein
MIDVLSTKLFLQDFIINGSISNNYLDIKLLYNMSMN